MEPDVARATVRAVEVRAALDLLMDIAAPMRVRVVLDAVGMAMTTHGSGPWWATVIVPTFDHAGRAAASVPRLELRQAIDAEALLVPEATCSVTVVADDVVRYGAFALAASEPESPPPRPEGPRVAIETGRFVDGRGSLPDGRVITVPTSSLERFAARDIGTVDVVDDPRGPYVVGASGTSDGSGPRLSEEVVVVVGAVWESTTPRPGSDDTGGDLT